MFTELVLYSTLCPPPNFPQRSDFKRLTCKLFRNMDLSSVFGLNSRFGAVWEGFALFRTGFALSFAEQLGLSKSNWRRASRTFSKTALRLCRSLVGQGSLSHGLSYVSVPVVTGWCDEKVALYSRRDVGHPAGQPRSEE